MIAYYLARFAVWFLPHLPTRWRDWLGYTGGTIAFHVARGKAAHTTRNQAVVLQALGRVPATPALLWPAAWRSARASWGNYGRYMAEFLGSHAFTRQDVAARTPIRGTEHMARALDEGRGVIITTAHFGAWDYAAAVLSGHYDANLYVAVDTFSPPQLDDLIRGMRRRLGGQSIAVESPTALRQMMRLLRDRSILALLIDRPSYPDGIPVTILGRPTALPAGAAALALRAEVTVLFGFSFKEGDQVVAEIHPVAIPTPTGDRAADLQSAMQAIADVFSAMVARDPAQWYMFRPFWPDLPPAAVPLAVAEGTRSLERVY